MLHRCHVKRDRSWQGRRARSGVILALLHLVNVSGQLWHASDKALVVESPLIRNLISDSLEAEGVQLADETRVLQTNEPGGHDDTGKLVEGREGKCERRLSLWMQLFSMRYELTFFLS